MYSRLLMNRVIGITSSHKSQAGHRSPWWLITLVLGTCWPSLGQQMTLVTTGHEDDAFRAQVSVAARFYGLDVQDLTVGASQGSPRLAGAVNQDTLAVIITSAALDRLDRTAVLGSLHKPDGARIPLLVVSKSSSGESVSLSRWTDDKVRECRPVQNTSDASISFTGSSSMATELRGVTLDLPVGPLCELVLAPGSTAEVLAELKARGQSSPALED